MAPKKLPADVLAYFRKQGAKGGKRSSARMTPAQRTARAKKASDAAVVARRKKQS